jgi:hypothetical protein
MTDLIGEMVKEARKVRENPKMMEEGKLEESEINEFLRQFSHYVVNWTNPQFHRSNNCVHFPDA